MIGGRSDVLKWLVDQPDGMYEAKEWHMKRSLTANGYYHALKGKLAAAIGTSNDELHRLMIERYSVVDPYFPPITAKAYVPVEKIPGYWTLYKTDGKWSSYLRLKGSSEMDSKEFSHLLDGLLSECEAVGVETLPPHEVEKLRGYEKHTE